MSNPEYSIIVPIYNSENHLKRCIDSILNQTFKKFELILIDDGSTDNSLNICKKYQSFDSRINVIHKDNGDVSSARNVGLDHSKGKYIVFVDSDDFVDRDMLSQFNQYDADLVVQGFSDFDGEKVTKVLIDEHKKWNILFDEDIENFLKLKSSVFVWGKKYKKAIIDKYQIRFKVDMKYNEDMIFNNEYILKIKSIENLKYVGYYHCQYKTPTLSSIVNNDSFLVRNHWRRIAYNQYIGHESIQEIYAKQFLYFAEKEVINISTSNLSYKKKIGQVKEIINNNFFQLCLKKIQTVYQKSGYYYTNINYRH